MVFQVTDELLLNYQRCNRRAFLSVYGESEQLSPPSDYLKKLIRDSHHHRSAILNHYTYTEPNYAQEDWEEGAQATLELMQKGVDEIHRGILVQETTDRRFISYPDLLVKQSHPSRLGEWSYVPVLIKMGKRPKLDYQLVAAFQAHLLTQIQGVQPETAWLFLREQNRFPVDLSLRLPQLEETLETCLQMLAERQEPEVFIARNRCDLCQWFKSCYQVAQHQQHLSLIPGVTPPRYLQLQELGIAKVEQLAEMSPEQLEPFPLFDSGIAGKLILQARSLVQQEALWSSSSNRSSLGILPSAPIELYFDIEAEPDLHLNYLHGVLVVDRQAQTEEFHALLAESPQEEEQAWLSLLALCDRYPEAPIFHFCDYEIQAVQRLAGAYGVSSRRTRQLLHRFVDIHAWVTHHLILPVESYALKSIARWMGFDWRQASANGAQAVFWYNQWLSTGNRHFLDLICNYNEDDCRATYHVKNWLVDFTHQSSEEWLQPQSP